MNPALTAAVPVIIGGIILAIGLWHLFFAQRIVRMLVSMHWPGVQRGGRLSIAATRFVSRPSYRRSLRVVGLAFTVIGGLYFYFLATGFLHAG